MPRRHGNHGTALRQERQAEKLRVRSDQFARRSARQLGAVIGLERMTDIRKAIASGDLPETIRPVPSRVPGRHAYAVNLGAITVVALYDPRGGTVTAFEAFDGKQARSHAVAHGPAVGAVESREDGARAGAA